MPGKLQIAIIFADNVAMNSAHIVHISNTIPTLIKKMNVTKTKEMTENKVCAGCSAYMSIFLCMPFCVLLLLCHDLFINLELHSYSNQS